jgi:1,4-dihydroxy-2-naphthoyl-CoA hydrolase
MGFCCKIRIAHTSFFEKEALMTDSNRPEVYDDYIREGTIHQALDITITGAAPDLVTGTMPVSEKTRQQAGVLHGGASCVLAESLASIGTYLNIDPARQSCFGIEINASHVRSGHRGLMSGEARPVYKGRANMVWEIKISRDDGKLACISRCTVAIVNRPTNLKGRALPGQPG